LKSEDSAAAIWQSLKADYGQLALGNMYHEFKGLLDSYILANQHPAPVLNKMQAHWEALMAVKTVSKHVSSATPSRPTYAATVSFSASAFMSTTPLEATEPLPEWLYAMLIVAKLLAQYAIIYQMAGQKKPFKLNPQDICCQILIVWDQHSSQCTHKDGGDAKKLSAVKRKPSNSSFSSQTLRPQQPAQQQPSRPQQLNAGHTTRRRRAANALITRAKAAPIWWMVKT
jgi:hypothetical protein